MGSHKTGCFPEGAVADASDRSDLSDTPGPGRPLVRALWVALLGSALAAALLCATAIAAERISVPLGDSPSQGPTNAQVTIVEFLDFQ